MSSGEVTLRERLGGRWAISRRAYLLSAPIAISLGVLVTPESTDSWSNFLIWTLVSTVAFLVSGIPLFIAHKTIMKDRAVRPVPIWLVYLVDIVAVEMRTLIFVASIVIFDLENSTPLPFRFLSGLVLSLAWYPAVTYALDSWDRYASMRNQLIAELVADEIEILNQEQVLEVLRVGLISDISAQVDESVRQAKDTLSSLRDAVAMEHSGEQTIATLNQINNDSIRRLSKELWNEKINTSKLRFIDLMRAIATSRPFRPGTYLPAVGLLSFILLSRVIGTQEAFIIGAIWLFYITVIVVVANKLCSRFTSLAFRIYVISLVLLALSGLLAYALCLSYDMTRVESSKWGIMAALTAAVFMPWFSSGNGITAHRLAVLNHLRSSINQAEIRSLAINGERALLNKQISTYLHGTVQANMSAAILRLQQSIEVGDRDGATAALIDAREALNLKWDTSLGTKIDNLSATLESIAGGWQGLVDIAIDVHPGVPDSFNTMIHDVTVDAINNAVRHGEAEKITVYVAPEPQGVSVVIQNNGHALDVINPGLGTETLNVYAPGNWTRETLENGDTELRVLLTR